MSPSNPDTPPRRQRRSSDEVRRLILEAAVQLFGDKGFAATTTREIAERAQVRETTMLRIYDSKEHLYNEAVLRPFTDFLDTFSTHWLDTVTPGGHPDEVLEQFVTELHDLVRENRALIAALGSQQASARHTQEALDHLESVGNAIAERYDLDFDVPVAIRIATASVIATTLLEDSLFPPELRGDRLRAELKRMLVGATLYRADR
ncbi:TetR/AcrR family transcriptional regulator [Nocardioides sp. NPDC101246]|uniref:TetR/AcrR family transcriptional regulator n=1 Tax=Nocardioides sp. NPDC101246 TaxID=3364336 RepID=UPI003806387A